MASCVGPVGCTTPPNPPAVYPQSGLFDGAAYTLTGPDGSVHRSRRTRSEKSPLRRVTICLSATAISPTNNRDVQFVRDDLGRIRQITTPEGSTLIYQYDQAGNWC